MKNALEVLPLKVSLKLCHQIFNVFKHAELKKGWRQLDNGCRTWSQPSHYGFHYSKHRLHKQIIILYYKLPGQSLRTLRNCIKNQIRDLSRGSTDTNTERDVRSRNGKVFSRSRSIRRAARLFRLSEYLRIHYSFLPGLPGVKAKPRRGSKISNKVSHAL